MVHAESTVRSSESESARPRVVVASTVTTMRVGPSSIDFKDALTGLEVDVEIDLISSIGPLAMMATVLA